MDDALLRNTIFHEQETLLNTIRTVIQEELRGAEISLKTTEKNDQQAGDVDDNVLGFLLSLQKGEDVT